MQSTNTTHMMNFRKPRKCSDRTTAKPIDETEVNNKNNFKTHNL